MARATDGEQLALCSVERARQLAKGRPCTVCKRWKRVSACKSGIWSIWQAVNYYSINKLWWPVCWRGPIILRLKSVVSHKPSGCRMPDAGGHDADLCARGQAS